MAETFNKKSIRFSDQGNLSTPPTGLKRDHSGKMKRRRDCIHSFYLTYLDHFDMMKLHHPIRKCVKKYW